MLAQLHHALRQEEGPPIRVIARVLVQFDDKQRPE